VVINIQHEDAKSERSPPKKNMKRLACYRHKQVGQVLMPEGLVCTCEAVGQEGFLRIGLGVRCRRV